DKQRMSPCKKGDQRPFHNQFLAIDHGADGVAHGRNILKRVFGRRDHFTFGQLFFRCDDAHFRRSFEGGARRSCAGLVIWLYLSLHKKADKRNNSDYFVAMTKTSENNPDALPNTADGMAGASSSALEALIRRAADPARGLPPVERWN